MYHPEVIARHAATVIRAAPPGTLPGGVLPRRSLDECWTLRDQLRDAVDRRGRRIRPLTPAEEFFIATERLRITIDFPYWVERYAIVAKEAQDASPLTPLWASQQLFHDRIAALDLARQTDGHPDGLLVNVLKARQLGLSTYTEAIVAHRASTQVALRGLIAADVQEQAEYLMGMAELILESLPWWLKPPVRAHQRGHYWESGGNTTIRVAYGKSARGGLQDNTKTKGNIGRGKTFGLLHLSELSTWERPEQIDDGLMPGVPIRPRTFAVAESTAKGRYDWWHQHWLAADRGIGRWTNIFIPWYIEPDKYWLPPPDGWAPSPFSRAHAATVERTSGQYCLGTTIRLTRAQLYWYESMRATFEAQGELYKFYEEYPATPEEAFQHAGRSIFPPAVLETLKTFERAPRRIVYVEPAKDIAQLRQWERAEAAESALPEETT